MSNTRNETLPLATKIPLTFAAKITLAAGRPVRGRRPIHAGGVHHAAGRLTQRAGYADEYPGPSEPAQVAAATHGQGPASARLPTILCLTERLGFSIHFLYGLAQ